MITPLPSTPIYPTQHTPELRLPSPPPLPNLHFISMPCHETIIDLAANAISTIADEMKRSDAMPKFLGTTAINMPGSIAKDQALTKLFGVVGGAAKVPAASFALFTVRDVSTMAAAFALPSPMSAKVWKAHWECISFTEKTFGIVG